MLTTKFIRNIVLNKENVPDFILNRNIIRTELH